MKENEKCQKIEINNIDIAILEDLQNLVNLSKKFANIVKELQEKKEINILDLIKYANTENISLVINLQNIIKRLSFLLLKNFANSDYLQIIKEIERIGK